MSEPHGPTGGGDEPRLRDGHVPWANLAEAWGDLIFDDGTDARTEGTLNEYAKATSLPLADGTEATGLPARVVSTITAARAALGAFDALCGTLFGYSIVDEWVEKPFTGDWDALTASAETWREIAAELIDMRTEVTMLVRIADEGWQGEAFDAFVDSTSGLYDILSPAIQASADVAEALDRATELAATILDIVGNGVDLVIGLCRRIAAEHAVAGPAVAIADVGSHAIEAARIAADVFAALDSYEACVTLLDSVVADMEAAHQTVRSYLEQIG